MNKVLEALFVLVIVAIVMTSCETKKKVKSSGKQYEVTFKEEGSLAIISHETGDTIRNLSIEIADTEPQRNQGLMYRSSMQDDQGMLFIFEQEEAKNFWMKNTYISLDLLFIESGGRVVKIIGNTVPYSESNLTCMTPSLYVLEVVGGFCNQYGIDIDDSIRFEVY